MYFKTILKSEKKMNQAKLIIIQIAAISFRSVNLKTVILYHH